MKRTTLPPTTRRAAAKAATARAILAAACDEFERVGFDAANLRAVGARAGVSAATVLHHFGDKRELLYATLDDALSETLEAALAQPPDAPVHVRIAGLTGAVMGFYRARPTLSRTLLKESLFADGAWRAHFNAQTATVHTHVAAWLADARARGEIGPGLDPVLGAAAFLSFFYFALLGWTQGAILDPAALVDRLVAQHLAGSVAVDHAPASDRHAAHRPTDTSDTGESANQADDRPAEPPVSHPSPRNVP